VGQETCCLHLGVVLGGLSSPWHWNDVAKNLVFTLVAMKWGESAKVKTRFLYLHNLVFTFATLSQLCQGEDKVKILSSPWHNSDNVAKVKARSESCLHLCNLHLGICKGEDLAFSPLFC
jgi:hypothetical protein